MSTCLLWQVAFPMSTCLLWQVAFPTSTCLLWQVAFPAERMILGGLMVVTPESAKTTDGGWSTSGADHCSHTWCTDS